MKLETIAVHGGCSPDPHARLGTSTMPNPWHAIRPPRPIGIEHTDDLLEDIDQALDKT